MFSWKKPTKNYFDFEIHKFMSAAAYAEIVLFISNTNVFGHV